MLFYDFMHFFFKRGSSKSFLCPVSCGRRVELKSNNLLLRQVQCSAALHGGFSSLNPVKGTAEGQKRPVQLLESYDHTPHLLAFEVIYILQPMEILHLKFITH